MKKGLNAPVFYFPTMCKGHPWISLIDVDPKKFSKAPVNSKDIFKSLGFNLPSL